MTEKISGLSADEQGIYRLRAFVDDGMTEHGFTTRSHGDMRDPVRLGALIERVNSTHAGLVVAQQVHGAHVVLVDQNDRDTIIPAADGLVTASSGVTLAVKGADCVPVLFYDRERTVVGVLHAGWRGIVAGVVAEGVALIGSMGISPEDLRVGLGPAIGPCCYQVVADVSDQLAGIAPGCIIHRDEGTFADLLCLVRHQFIDLGVPERSICQADSCTSCSPDLWHSYRRDKPNFGLHAGFITLHAGL